MFNIVAANAGLNKGKRDRGREAEGSLAELAN